LLGELRRGRTLQKAVDQAFRNSKIPPQELPALVQRWFHNWAALGWFCQPEQKAAVAPSKKPQQKESVANAR
jgi:hypothetical protein